MAYEDLLKDTSVAVEDGNYFLVTITDLDINKSYPIQFRWNYKDGTQGPWSVSKTIITPGEEMPGTPDFLETDLTNETPGAMTINWRGKDTSNNDLNNIDRIDVYIDGAPFDATKPAVSIKSPAKQLVYAPEGTYLVRLYAVTTSGTMSGSTTREVVVGPIGTQILDPVNPSAPTISAGLASIIVSWDGKTAANGSFADGSFAGAKVYIGTTANFTPSADNWVHSLNFANGNNQVSIGVGTVINKSTGTTLAYGTPYFIKLRTVNASGTETTTAIASSPTNITVSKLPASEISTGILSADASITAGASAGARVVMSGASSPFIIYGTDGTTKLLEFIGGTTGTLSITGSGKFTGDLEIGTGNSIFKATSSGIWLGNTNYADADFRVSSNGIIRANSGTIGGWTLASSYLSGTNFEINSNDSTIYLGPKTGSHFRITNSSIAHYNNTSTSGAFTLTTGTYISPGNALNTDASLIMSGKITAGTISIGKGVVAATTNPTVAEKHGVYMDSNNYWLSDGTFKAGGTSKYIYWNGATFEIKGDIYSSSGTIGGFGIGTNYIGTADPTTAGSFYIGTSGNARFNNITATGNLTTDGGLVLTTKTSTTSAPLSAGGNDFNNVGNISSTSGDFYTVNGKVRAGGELVADLAKTASVTAATNCYITTDGYVRKTSNTSSMRYKENITDISNVPELDPKLLLNLPVRAFTYKEDHIPSTDDRAGKVLPGFIAEEVDAVYPIAADYENGNVETWNSFWIVPGLLALIQDLNRRLDALEA